MRRATVSQPRFSARAFRHDARATNKRINLALRIYLSVGYLLLALRPQLPLCSLTAHLEQSL
jgi:hypothetical protein